MWVTPVTRENGRGNEKERTKMNLRIMLWLLAFSQPLWAAAPKPVTLVVDDVPVVQVLQALVAQENRNLVVSPDVSGTLSLNLTRVPWRQALRTVVSSAGLVLREEGGIFYVHTAAWQREQRERSEQEQARRQLDAPLVTQGIPFSYADAGELQKAAEKLLSPKGSLSVDTRTNRLLIRDNQAAVDTLRRWAAEMDIPIEQVELAAHIVTINEKSLRELGVKWNLADATDATDAGKVGQLTTLGSDLSVASATSHVGFNIGRINGRLLDLELSALEQKQQVDIIASPRLLASHGQPASIKQGSEIPYQVSSGESGATSVEFKEAVLGMEVTPVVLPGGTRAPETTHQRKYAGTGSAAGRWRNAGYRQAGDRNPGGGKKWRNAGVGRNFFPEEQNRQ